MDNEIFEGLADLFVNNDTLCDLHMGDMLRCDQLDFSLESLDVVDDYLDGARTVPGTDHENLMAVLRAGAYLGEVVRRACRGRVHWLTFENAAPTSKVVDKFGKQPSTLGVLQHNRKSVTFPLGRVVKFLHFGRDESLRLFADSIVFAHAV